ncbi:EAL domain-containing protein [Rubrivirga sp. S365]|uniref:EAL domain-containing protein n=1 Tax=Rubrivirga litoralis TaxID=3075598 RepID=A0ABU3BU72_9BACT|nr:MULTISPECIES: EAL domain-containing protein [unclassified Rubrivirga]MDT0632839.1 EAL domain-containing protein [Rubrivirga sp. F394]MDT7855117.1 EAL domain-containing protein [Rubrivirga sp. S365]
MPTAPAATIEIHADGRVAASPAAAALAGLAPEAADGRPLADWVAPEDRPTAEALVGRVRDGEADHVSLRVRSRGGAPLWVTLCQAPDGRVAGQVRAGRGGLGRDDAGHADRLRLLATVMSQGDLPFEDQAQQALALTASLLGLDVGTVSRIEGDDYTVVACHGAAMAPGDRFDLGDTYCSITIGGRDLFEIAHAAASPHRRHPCYLAFGLEAYVGAPLSVGGAPWGTLAFSSSAPLAAPLSDADRDLIRVLATWAGGALDRHERTEALAAQNRHLQAVVDQSPIVLFALDGDGAFTLQEGRGLRALGVEPGASIGQNVFELYADVPEAVAALRRVLGGEERTWSASVGPLHYESWAAPTTDDAGHVVGATGVSIDVTDLHHAEARLTWEAERLHRLLDVTAVDGALDDRAPVVLATVAELLGLDTGALSRAESDAEGGAFACVAAAPPRPATDDQPGGLPLGALALAAGDVVAVEDLSDSAHRHHAAAGVGAYVGVPVVVDGVVWGALGFWSDRPAPCAFTDRDADLVRLAAQWAGGAVARDLRRRALAESEGRLRALGQSTTEGIAFTEGGVVIDCNDQFAALIGLPSTADAVGRAATDFVAPEHVGAVREAIAAERTEPYEIVVVRADGSRAWVEVQGGSLVYGGRPVRMTAVRDVTDRHELAARLRHQAAHDDLTGLPNRARFRDRIDRIMASGAPFGVLFIDLDRFKVVNDSLGHEAGDGLLKTVAARLRRAVGVHDGALVARLGGDEFGVIVPETGGAAGGATEAVAYAVLDALGAPVDLGARAVQPGASVGVVARGEAYADREALLRDADTAMYAAKHAGRGGVTVFDPSMHEAAAARFGLEHDLRQAIDDGQLRALFQPIVDLDSGAAVGFESLVRWQHPDLGLLGPDRFLPVAEEVGLVAEVDRWVLEATCREMGRWAPHLDADSLLWISVNCSDQTFLAAGLAERARAAADAAGLRPEHVVLELTERALVDADAAREALAAIRAHGLQLCVDDFGSGYSSLGLLHTLPVDGLKIDRSFVTGLGTSRAARSLVRAVVQIADDLGLRVVAEGIETADQLAALRDLGCPLGQGYLFSRPVPPDAARALLAAPPWADAWAE